MKDEEMAEEYICNGKCQDDITRNYVHCKTCTRIKDFLAGLKAGRPQWHDLQEDPSDLPEEDGFYLVKLDNDGLCNYEIDSFYLDDNFVLYGKYVIAWCEISTFDKE